MAKVRIAFIVGFAGRFPIDMLRHDTCYPAHETDADAITQSLTGTRQAREVALHKVVDVPASDLRRLRQADPNDVTHETARIARITIGRWHSFGVAHVHSLTVTVA